MRALTATGDRVSPASGPCNIRFGTSTITSPSRIGTPISWPSAWWRRGTDSLLINWSPIHGGLRENVLPEAGISRRHTGVDSFRPLWLLHLHEVRQVLGTDKIRSISGISTLILAVL